MRRLHRHVGFVPEGDIALALPPMVARQITKEYFWPSYLRPKIIVGDARSKSV
jgi:hypothetical protein